MQTLKAQAQILAQREVPALIYGETGTALPARRAISPVFSSRPAVAPCFWMNLAS
ncbi:MAG: hypothetical protein P8Y45_23330 [Exilibacterium sp.]